MKYLVADKSSSFTVSELLNKHKSIVPDCDFEKEHSRTIQISVPQPKLTNQWWETFARIPLSQNPLNSANEGVIDDIKQPGNIHFLGGAFGASEPITRNVTVANNQSIVFPILTFNADNVGWDFSFLPGFEKSPVPYQFSINDLKIIAKAVMDTAENVSLTVNDKLLITDANKDEYRQASRSPYTLNLPAEDDIFGYRASYPAEWVKPPYTKGVQDGIWVELKNLPLGENTIHFTGTLDYSDIVVKDYNNSGSIGDSPLEFLLGYVRDNFQGSFYDITYNVDVLSRREFNAQLSV